MTYKLEIINNHYIININDKKMLIDTGSPLSISFVKEFNEVKINNTLFSLNHIFNEPTISNIFDLVGLKIDGFIGMDVIRKFGILISKKEMSVEFNVIKNKGNKMPLIYVGNAIAFKAVINGIEGKYIIDTGAKYSYGKPILYKGLKETKKVEDYSPSLNLNFESFLYETNLLVNEREINCLTGLSKDVVKILNYLDVLMIGNITHLFEDYFCINIKNNYINFL